MLSHHSVDDVIFAETENYNTNRTASTRSAVKEAMRAQEAMRALKKYRERARLRLAFLPTLLSCSPHSWVCTVLLNGAQLKLFLVRFSNPNISC